MSADRRADDPGVGGADSAPPAEPRDRLSHANQRMPPQPRPALRPRARGPRSGPRGRAVLPPYRGCLRLAGEREGGGEASSPLGLPWALSSGTGALRLAPTCRPPGVVLGVCRPPLPRGKRPREGRGGRAVGPSLVCRVAFILSEREAPEPEYKS